MEDIRELSLRLFTQVWHCGSIDVAGDDVVDVDDFIRVFLYVFRSINIFDDDCG